MEIFGYCDSSRINERREGIKAEKEGKKNGYNMKMNDLEEEEKEGI